MGPGPIKSGGSWQVTAAHADHVQPFLDSLAYRLDSDDGSVVLTGDTAPCDSVTQLARGADVLMMMCWESHEFMAGTEHAAASCSIRGAAETAQEADVKQLVLVHIGARLTRAEMQGPREQEAAQAFSGKVVWGDEGMVVPWPEG
jgi:ribonuclease BN (tRNA processing enzyme)